MEMVRLASAHVKRTKFKQSLHAVLQCTSDRLRAAVTALGDNANLGDVMRSSVVDTNIRDALSQLLFFSSEVVGADGARQQLRHEQNGAMLMLLVGLNKEGMSERFVVSLLDECPAMPTASRMLEMLAENPVAQARFFILSMRLFLQHVLGIAPFDKQLRANGTTNGVEFPDGCSAAFMGGSFGAIAHLHGPIEEQARLACYPHIVLHFVNRASQMWLRRVLRQDASAAKALLRKWQSQTLLAEESLMSSCPGSFTSRC
eukprot:s4406_g5.t1